LKTTPPPAAASPFLLWRTLALVSLVINLGLVGWVWRHANIQRPPASIASAPAPVAEPQSHPDLSPKTLGANSPYAALGSFMAENNRIPDLNWTGPQFAAFLQGFRASYEGRGLPLDDEAKRLRDDISRRVEAMLAREQPNPIEDFFRTLREKEGVLRTASGLHYRITEPGFGVTAAANDTVVLSFSAQLPDGRALPALSRTRVRVAVKDLLPGLAEGVQLLRVGGKALMYLSPSLSFSESNWPANVPHGMPLSFFVELHEIAAARPQ
jgi:FKBP-type peptidyl-prolyl cis-trans isomerase FkpA